MYRRLSQGGATAILVTAALTLGGCTQATRHSNMMIFGTNTVVGLSAGKDVDTPTITVGYKRQELVLMPLVANEKEAGTHELVPCKMTGGTAPANHPCLLVATRGEGEHKVARDSYSVLASFGANFDSGVDTKVTAKGGLAQYFATGMAAQLLALSGGAAVVATGQAAATSVTHKPDAEAVAALTGDPALAAALADSRIKEAVAARKTTLDAAIALAGQYLGKVPEGPAFTAEIGALDTASGMDGNLTRTCAPKTKAACLAEMGDVFVGHRDPDRIARAVLERSAAKGAGQ